MAKIIGWCLNLWGWCLHLGNPRFATEDGVPRIFPSKSTTDRDSSIRIGSSCTRTDEQVNMLYQ